MKITQADVKRLDHLGLVAGFCQEIGLKELIDKKIKKRLSRSHLSNGQVLIAMLLNGLGFVSRTLHMYPEYFADKPTEQLLGPGILPKHINDDVLGRLLDALYEEGVSSLYQEIAWHVVQHLGLACRSVNMDTTSFHLDGKYEQDIGAQCIHITRGYSRDHRPDLNQVILKLVTENQAGIPVYMQACSGNSNDTKLFEQMVTSHLSSLKAAYQSKYLIGDASLYSQEIVQALAAQHQLFITRVPQKLNEAKALLASAPQAQWTELANGYAGAWCESTYAGVKQQWLLVRSTHAKKREHRQLDAHIRKATQQSVKSFKQLCRQSFACETDAKAALAQWESAQSFTAIHEASILRQDKYHKRGRPSTSEEATTTFHITGHIMSSLSARQHAQQDKGLFILATNDLDDTLSMQFVLDEYKSQQAVERGFRFLKSPDFLTSSLFLKKPERIEALLMVMTCCLLIYAALEYLIRKNLAEKGMFFPDMKKKPTQRPTARWVFFCFQGISLLTINHQPPRVTNLIERHTIILNCLGPPYWQFYSSFQGTIEN